MNTKRTYERAVKLSDEYVGVGYFSRSDLQLAQGVCLLWISEFTLVMMSSALNNERGRVKELEKKPKNTEMELRY